MDKNEEYAWINNAYKGEDWICVEAKLDADSNFVKQESYVYKSKRTGEVYKFIPLGSSVDAFVARIEVKTEFSFKPIPFSVTDKTASIEKYEKYESKNKAVALSLKLKVVSDLKHPWSLKGFVALLNELSHLPSIKSLREYLGMPDKAEFFQIQFLELDFEKYGGLLCKLLKRKPSKEHRVIKTQYGTFYAIPIENNFEDLIDCLISYKTLVDIIGFQGILDIYDDCE